MPFNAVGKLARESRSTESDILMAVFVVSNPLSTRPYACLNALMRRERETPTNEQIPAMRSERAQWSSMTPAARFKWGWRSTQRTNRHRLWFGYSVQLLADCVRSAEFHAETQRFAPQTPPDSTRRKRPCRPPRSVLGSPRDQDFGLSI